MFDPGKIQLQANAYASTLGCKVAREGETFTMTDEENVVTNRVVVKDGGLYKGRQMMAVTDDEGEMLLEAFGQLLAKIMWC